MLQHNPLKQVCNLYILLGACQQPTNEKKRGCTVYSDIEPLLGFEYLKLIN